ncbi:3-phenylpropionate/trans-cinnamate dioxygenase ferredoxin subunit [Paraburkholderia unamae]|uniref:Rieske (2Fe-2S) protein n=1 Tax=Paraburkholderia unamae TaxID=219649 RepID=UPI000DC55694|nr:Rieske 2Fe-2S domain-containing protein [Paraburkholderia unamae]RAR57886.1 3-phenylpropionate/trans-cinnamate dioxygenase ferredoxin subunit [Paraburkholderia unamae]
METEKVAAGAQFVDAMASSELASGAQRAVNVNGRSILLCRVGGEVHALANLCPHAHQPLEGGAIEGGAIRCPRHGACFDLASGASLNGVTRTAVRTFAVRERAGRIEVDAPRANVGYFPDFSQDA